MALYKFDTQRESDEFEDLLQAISCILRITRSSRRKIDTEKFGQFVKETHLKFHDLFPWMKDNESLHALLGHIVKSIEENRGYGFGQKWEGTLEAVHQLFRLYRKSVTRKTNKEASKTDIMTRIYSADQKKCYKYCLMRQSANFR